MRRDVLLAIVIAAAGVPAGAAGQVADSLPADSVRYLGGIRVDVGRPALMPGGSSAVEIDLGQVTHAPTPTLEEVLRQAPLVMVRPNSRGEAQPALRGSEDRQVAILLDGVPLTLGWDHRTDMSVIPLTAARSVTLVRGLPSVLYGPNTLGGVVEVDVARAGGRLLTVDPLTFGLSFDQAGTKNLSVTGGLLGEGTGNQWAFRAGVGVEDRPGSPLAAALGDDRTLRGRFLSDGDLRLNSDARRIDGFGLVRYSAEGGAWASLSASASDAERGVPPEAHQDAPRLWRYPEQRRLIAAASAGTGQRDTGLGRGDLEVSLGVDVGSTLIEQFTSESFQTVAETEEADDLVVTLRLLGDHTLGSRGELRAAATLADVRHDEVLTPGRASDYRQRLWSVAAETAWSLDARRGTTLTVGASLDGSDTPESGDKPPLEALTAHGVRVGMSSLLRPGLLAHTAVSRRARFPSLRELYSAALGRFEPNPDLRPETLVGAEAGMSAEGGRAQLQLVAFWHRLEDGIVRTSVVGSDGVSRFQRINQAEVRSRGVELLAAARVGFATLSGDLTLQRVRGVDEGGGETRLEYEPVAYGRVRVELPVPGEARASVEGRFVGRQWCENPEAGGLERLRGSRSFGLDLTRDFTVGSGGALRRWGVTIAASNLTDAAVFGQCGLPEPGRLLRIQLRVR